MKDELNIQLYRTMYLIRRAEEAIRENYPKDEMKTPMHMSMGEEAIVAGVCQALRADDQVLGTYRSHGLYLAKTGQTDCFFAEMYGKETGCAIGKAGSMHLSAPDYGLLCCSAIVASSIPVALGAALANIYQGNGKRVAVFFGDGAVDAGVFWESMNFACLKQLPILFVCEDNAFAVHTHREKRHGFDSVNRVVSRFNCNVFEESTTDAEVIYDATSRALQVMNENKMPCFLRFHYYRYLEHVGIYEDFEAGYRSKQEYSKWLKQDPIKVQRDKLLSTGMPLDELMSLEKEIDSRVQMSVESARDAEIACASRLHEGVMRCG
jgi:acetoin:2,6-dichlorophenolindophenol oxidoreductase subunit alpha